MSHSTGRSYFLQGILLSFAGAICFSTKAILVKLAYRDTAIDAITLLAWRMIFSLPFFLVSASVSSARQGNQKFTPKQWLGIALTGCMGYYISSLLDFLGLQYVTAGIERLVLFIYPTLVLLMSAVIFRQKIKPVQWAALAVTYIGLCIAFFGEVNIRSEQSSGFIYGSLLIFICAITYATYIVGSGRLIPAVGALKFNSYAMSFAAVGVLAHFFITSKTSLLQLTPQAYGYSFLMAVLSTVIPSYLVAAGIKRIGADNAAIVGSVGPVSTILMAFIFLGESISIYQIFGTVMILGGVLLIGKQK